MTMDPGLHAPDCDVHRFRSDVLGSLAETPSDEALLGALIEYYGQGDQEVETCNCGWSPTSALADAMLGTVDDPGEADHTLIYEALRPFMQAHAYRRLGAALELCPLHYCDIRICADDGLHGDEVYD